MNYFYNEIDSSGYIYSVDMIRVNFTINARYEKEFSNYFSDVFRADIYTYRSNFSEYKYKHLVTIDYGESKMSVGFGFNGYKANDGFRGFFEVNPNKCFNNDLCINDINFIKSVCDHNDFDIIRLDLAVDLPVQRSLVRLVKDKRKYQYDLNHQS